MSEETAWGFRVTGSKTGDDWTVSLPHQCDRWDIAGDDFNGEVSHAVAVDQLRDFLAEGEAALRALLARHEFGSQL
jgi:hypothetical protein